MTGGLIIILLLLIYAAVVFMAIRRSKSGDVVAARLEAVRNQGTYDVSESDAMTQPFSERFLRPSFMRLVKLVEGLIPINLQAQQRLNEKLKCAGIRQSVREYLARNIVIAAVVVLIAFVLFQLMGAAVALFAYYVLSRFLLERKIKARRKAIGDGMPDVLDLLSVSVSAGLGFDQALQHVVARCKGPLVEELAVAQREITLGVPRAEALQRLVQRCDVDQLTTFVNSITQADQLGIPIANVLVAQSHSIREKYRQEIEERAARLPVKIIIPLVFLVLPTLFLVLLAPAMLNVMRTLGSM